MSTRNKIISSVIVTAVGQIFVVYTTWMCAEPIRSDVAGGVCGTVLFITSGILAAIWTGARP